MIEIPGSDSLTSYEQCLVNEMMQEIRYRAQYMLVEYDEEDFGYYKLPDGHLVVLIRSIYLPFPVSDEDSGPPSYMVEYERQKTPNVYLVYPDQPPEQPITPGTYFTYWLPKVHVRIPQLVSIATPDGKVRIGDHSGMIDHIAHKETDERVKGILDRIYKRITDD
jgi:hypothetical protein